MHVAAGVVAPAAAGLGEAVRAAGRGGEGVALNAAEWVCWGALLLVSLAALNASAAARDAAAELLDRARGGQSGDGLTVVVSCDARQALDALREMEEQAIITEEALRRVSERGEKMRSEKT